MAAPKININRYRLITLLYVVFVCLSVLNVPVSLLESNYHVINTFVHQEQSTHKQIEFANRVIAGLDVNSFNDTGRAYLALQKKVHFTYNVVDSVDKVVNDNLAAKGTTINKEFNNKIVLENILVKNALLERLKDVLFDLSDFIGQQHLGDNLVKDLTPISEEIKTISGANREWNRYLWLHKPTAMSYMQLKRVKVILLENELQYQVAALNSRHIVTSFYDEVAGTPFVDTSKPGVKTADSANRKRDSDVRALEKVQPPVTVAQSEKANPTAVQERDTTKKFDGFFQKILFSMHAEHLFVGIQNQLIQDLPYEKGRDFELSISPEAEISRQGKNYAVVFKNKGNYVLRFTDIRNGNILPLFEKKVSVSMLPNPMVKLNGDNNFRDMISVKNLLAANRLSASIGINDLAYFPGRINGFWITRVSRSKEQTAVYNYGEVFQSEAQALIRKLDKGDLVLFDRITLSLHDGSTRTTNSIVYKIEE